MESDGAPTRKETLRITRAGWIAVGVAVALALAGLSEKNNTLLLAAGWVAAASR